MSLKKEIMVKIKSAIVAAICSMNLATAFADVDPGVYFQILGGASLMPGLSTSYQSGVETIQDNTTFKNGYNAMFAFGYRFPESLRTDLTVGYIDNRISSNYSNTINNNIQSGSAEAYTFFGNLYYDFAACSVLQPYVGAGLGYVTTRYKWQINNDTEANKYTTSPGFFGYQAVAGLNYHVTPNFGLLLDYRYVGTTTSTQTISSTANSGKYNISFSSNLVSIGISYLF